jgi:uridine phosphorylase
MKDLITDASTLFVPASSLETKIGDYFSIDFPRTADQRVYHLGIRAGEVANRIVSYQCGVPANLKQDISIYTSYLSQITVGSPSRADRIANFLDASPKPFRLTTERGFMTITGRYRGVPISVISIGMGSSMADFFVREVRECLSGDMVVVRSMPISHNTS